MSAGSGLTHSEYNGSKTDEVNFLQIWVFPKQEDIKPRYDQKVFESSDRANKIQTVVSPDDDQALWINQDAWFSLANVSERNNITYPLNKTGNGVYLFVIEGQVKVGEDTLEKRDAIGISEVDQFTVSASKDTELLFIEVPMN